MEKINNQFGTPFLGYVYDFEIEFDAHNIPHIWAMLNEHAVIAVSFSVFLKKTE